MLPSNTIALIVDDDPEICKLLTHYLGNRATVIDAHDGADALEKIMTIKPDVIFLDIGLPGSLSGIVVMRVLRLDPELNHIHIVVVSGREPEDIARSDVLKADAFITKPFSRQDLLDWYQAYSGGLAARLPQRAAE